MFFDGHERDDVVEYKETFLSEMKLHLPYFVEFSNNRSILPKIYLDDYIVGDQIKDPLL